MKMSHSKQVSSLTAKRLSPLAKPFTLNPSKPLFEQYPSLEFPKRLDFDGLNLNGSHHLDDVKDFSFPTYSTRVTPLGCDCEKGKHAVDELDPFPSDGIFKKSTATISAEDILTNSKVIVHAVDEPSSFLVSNYKVVTPLKLSTADTDMSSAKRTLQNQSSENLGDSDSDVDSPCWKGTMAFSRTSTEISGSAQPCNVNKSTEKHNSLNPLAPQFFPGIGYIKDDFGSSKSNAPAVTNSLSGQDSLMKTVMAESPVELNKGVKLQYSTNICRRENAFNAFNDPMSSRSKSKDFPAKGLSPTPSSTISSSQVCVLTDLVKTFEGLSKSLIESPKPDAETIVCAMHVLSELLVQNCVNGVELDDYHDRNMTMILQTINNLNDFSTNIFGHKIPTLDSTSPDSPFCQTLELPKGLEITSMENQTVPYQRYMQNDYMRQNIVPKGFGKIGQISFPSSSSEDAGNEIAKVIRRSLGKRLDFGVQMHPEALLFRNLWLDSVAECCYRKYIMYRCLMEAGVDVNSTNLMEELLR